MNDIRLKIFDSIYTAAAGILSIQFFSSAQDIQAVYSMFVQSLVATAAIGKLIWDWKSTKKKDPG